MLLLDDLFCRSVDCKLKGTDNKFAHCRLINTANPINTVWYFVNHESGDVVHYDGTPWVDQHVKNAICSSPFHCCMAQEVYVL